MLHKTFLIRFIINTMDVKTVTKWKPKYDRISAISDRKKILQFLPKSVEYISTDNFFHYKSKKFKTAYVIDLIHSLLMKYYFKRRNRFELMATILKKRYGQDYNYYIDYLVDMGFLIFISSHQKGKKSRTYSLSEKIINGDISRFSNTDKFLIKKLKERNEWIESETIEGDLIDFDVKGKLVSDLYSVKIDFARSIFYLDSLKSDDNDIYNRNRYSVECISDGQIFYHFDKYGRMHTNFTILKSFIRKNCLLIDNLETSEIDIKNSQPLFLTKIIESTGTNWIKQDEFELFKTLTLNGSFYKHIMNYTNIDKSDAKELTYKVLFGRNSASSKSDQIFKKIFPTIYNFIKLYKKEHGDYKILAYNLQKSESNLIFNKIIKDIMNQCPYVKVITVHDSIVFPTKFKDEVSAIFYSRLYEEFNII
jgi:hypothetical protein